MAYRPNVIVEDISKMTKKEWLEARKGGLGGSDAAAVLGISPWTTKRELFLEKTGQLKKEERDDAGWLTLEVGHALEPVAADLFARKNPGKKVVDDRRMFRHPDHPMMIADLDRVIIDKKTGQVAILEIKTCDPHTLDKWGDPNDNTIPAYYEAQARHYMAVTGIGMVVFAVLAGTRESGYRQRYILRDEKKEAELIEAEEAFWNDYVLKNVEPPVSEEGDPSMAIAALASQVAPQDGAVPIPEKFMPEISEIIDLDEKIKAENKAISDMKKARDKALAPVLEALGGHDGTMEVGNATFTVKRTTRTTTGIRSGELPALRLSYPDAYDEFVKTSSSAYFKTSCKEKKA